MTEFYDYIVCVEKNGGKYTTHLCYAPFMSFIKVGDIVEIPTLDAFLGMLRRNEHNKLMRRDSVVGMVMKDDCITSDDIMKLYCNLENEFQRDAVWVMHPKTRMIIRQFKDNSGDYMIEDGEIFGPIKRLKKPLITSDKMPEPKVGNLVVCYGSVSIRAEVIAVGTISMDKKNESQILNSLERIKFKTIKQELTYKEKEEMHENN
jgi:hypothetical protein